MKKGECFLNVGPPNAAINLSVGDRFMFVLPVLMLILGMVHDPRHQQWIFCVTDTMDDGRVTSFHLLRKKGMGIYDHLSTMSLVVSATFTSKT